MEFTIAAEGGLLRTRVWGREAQQPPTHICDAMLAEAKRLGLTRILVELTQKVALSGVNQFLLIDRLPSIGLTPQHRLALVHHTPGFYEANDMIDIVAGNRGLNVKNFRDVDSALAWLGKFRG
jgi:hypothetical protein